MLTKNERNNQKCTVFKSIDSNITKPMVTLKSKANVGITLLLLFLLTLVTGVILHLKSHGTIIQPRGVIKIIHWVSGFLMVAFFIWHALDFRKMLNAMKKKYLWFWIDTYLVCMFTILAFASGLLKLLSPVKIMHLGLWHYWFGLLLAATALIHLIRGIPAFLRMRRIK